MGMGLKICRKILDLIITGDHRESTNMKDVSSQVASFKRGNRPTWRPNSGTRCFPVQGVSRIECQRFDDDRSNRSAELVFLVDGI